jgi:predicted N-acyltransferase
MAEHGSMVLRVASSMADVERDAWDQCANPDPGRFDPFVSYDFLTALETAGATGEEAGWIPHHLLMGRPGEGIRAALPLYIKTNSQGEFVFDQGWADALHRIGGRYYPKLQAAVPFTPVPGRRLLVRPGPGADEVERSLAEGALELCRRLGGSSLHITFCSEGEWRRLAEAGLLQRMGVQYHWPNAGYGCFEDFLATLSSRKRKMIRREREAALAGGFEIELVAGRAITEAHWDAFFGFYMDTGSRKWGRPYLNRRFFSLIGAAMPERCLLVLAKRNDRAIAGAFNMRGGDCLYGRYWGAIEEVPFLHFEVCYYQAIDYAIAHGLARVEAGAQGEHKLMRGYAPVPTYSLHWLADRRLHRAVGEYLERERSEMTEACRALTGQGPYRRDASGG